MFRKEDRYLVHKRTDLEDALETADLKVAARIRDSLFTLTHLVYASRVKRGVGTFVGVVVEGDWPEYEPVCKAIERRMGGHVATRTEGCKFTPSREEYRVLSQILERETAELRRAIDRLQNGNIAKVFEKYIVERQEKLKTLCSLREKLALLQGVGGDGDEEHF